MSKEMGVNKKNDISDHGEDGGFSEHSANSGDELLAPSENSAELIEKKTQNRQASNVNDIRGVYDIKPIRSEMIVRGDSARNIPESIISPQSKQKRG